MAEVELKDGFQWELDENSENKIRKISLAITLFFAVAIAVGAYLISFF
jgi:hypothetical protein